MAFVWKCKREGLSVKAVVPEAAGLLCLLLCLDNSVLGSFLIGFLCGCLTSMTTLDTLLTRSGTRARFQTLLRLSLFNNTGAGSTRRRLLQFSGAWWCGSDRHPVC